MKVIAILAFFVTLLLGYFYYEIDKDVQQFSQKVKTQQLDYQAYTKEEIK